ncbi:hypothetical protein [Streptomyces melanogenes]|uniref:hypothetical protein n=1 Tax=Streptomyces melanogenes TaxID=67326 RepID=UPI0019AC0DCE|nr:hypothetical protein [Streptomyces melanogenes]GGP85167.1 hypothetical protein GCM10010278_74540 [Streptomyces melanogenes]
MERAETPRALGWREVVSRFSTSRWSTPYPDSRADRVSPTGPPPTTSTDVFDGNKTTSIGRAKKRE